MSIFSQATYQDDIQQKDSLGGGFKVLDSDIYLATIKLAYVTRTAKGGINVNLELDIDGHTHKESLYVQNDKGKNYYDTNGNKGYYHGFTIMDDIALFSNQKPLSELQDEEKIINVYNFQAKKEVPTAVPVLTELLGKQIKVAITKDLVNKQEKVGDEYVATSETKEENKISKIFSPNTNLTAQEARSGKTEAEFHDKWLEKWKGNVNDKTVQVIAKPTTTTSPTKSLFS